MREKTCCFTGHRKLPKDKIGGIVKRLECEIDNLIVQGVTDFISGGALCFDQIAASFIIARKQAGRGIRLIFALPCREQEKLWDNTQKMLYYDLLAKADEIVYVSEDYSVNCMKKRNYYMVDRSAYCISALLYERSGTGQAVKYARSQGLRVVDVARQTINK